MTHQSEVESPEENNALTSVHFRFFCLSPAVEKLLIDSISRTWNELSAFFSQLPLSIDLENNYNLSLYPFNKSVDVTHLNYWEPDVYTSKHGLCGSPEISDSGGLKRLGNGFLKNLYNEQFVFRLSIFIKELEIDKETLGSIIHNLLQNSDIPGSSFLSFEVENADASFIDIGSYIPELSERFTYQPLHSQSRKDAKPVTREELGWNDRIKALRWIDNSSAYETNFTSINENKERVDGPTINMDDGSSIKLGTIVGSDVEDEAQSVSFLSYEHEGINYPLWVLGDSEVESELSFFRVVNLPRAKNIKESMKMALEYPSLSKFSDSWGTEYLEVLMRSEIGTMVDILQEGLQIERDVLSDGTTFFRVELAFSDLSEVAVFEGSSHLLEIFLEKVVQYEEEISPINMESLMSISSELNCLPEQNEKKLIKFNIN